MFALIPDSLNYVFIKQEFAVSEQLSSNNCRMAECF